MQAFYQDDEALGGLEAAVALAVGADRRAPLVALAWFLRQRDSQRALALADEAGTWPLEPADRGRLHLIRAEVAVLMGDRPAALRWIERAADDFAAAGDPIGSGDVQFARAMIAHAGGQISETISLYRAAAVAYRAAGDEARAVIATGWSVLYGAFGDPEGARRASDLAAAGPVPGLDAIIDSTAAILCYSGGDMARAAALYARASERARPAGLIRQAVIAAGNAGSALQELGDTDAAADWIERSLTLAQRTGWPSIVGGSLTRLGELMRKLGQLDRSRELLVEAVDWYGRAPGNPNLAVTEEAMGLTLLELGRAAEAASWFDRAADSYRGVGQTEGLVTAMIGAARAVAAIDPAEALARLDQAAAAAAEFQIGRAEIEMLRARAEIAGRSDPSAALVYLEKAMAAGLASEGWIAPIDLLTDLARGWEMAGRPLRALSYERDARRALEQRNLRLTAARAVLAEVRHETERMRMEAEHHRHLAEAETDRARLLEDTNRVLEDLARVGRDITASLDTQTVVQRIYDCAHGLVDLSCLLIFRAEEEALTLCYGIEDDRPIAPMRLPLDDPQSSAVRAFHERREILIETPAGDAPPSLVPETRLMQTALFAPLPAGDRIWGVLTVQSDRPSAYGARERQIFRTLTAYAAVALNNADSLQALQAAQAKLAQQEKLASLGRLVAGVAHEMNTPLGVAITAVTALEGEVQSFRARLADGGLKRADLLSFLDHAGGIAGLIADSTTRAVSLVRKFKEIASASEEEEARPIDLAHRVSEILEILREEAGARGVELSYRSPGPLIVLTKPTLVTAAMMALIQNAFQHAFPGVQTPRVDVALERRSRRIALQVADNGIGMDGETRSRAFDPFFTTARHQGGTGLGLLRVHNLVTGSLGGEVRIDSAPGAGCRVEINLPA